MKNYRKICNYEALLSSCIDSIKHLSFNDGTNNGEDSSDSDSDVNQSGRPFEFTQFKSMTKLESIYLETSIRDEDFWHQTHLHKLLAEIPNQLKVFIIKLSF